MAHAKMTSEPAVEPPSPRSNFAAKKSSREVTSMRIMTSLDSKRVERIKVEFDARNDAVDLYDFIKIMEDNLPNEFLEGPMAQDRRELASNLIDLFKEVDVNGDESMEWEEFTRFMVEKAAAFKELQSMDRIPDYCHNKPLQITSMGTVHRHHRHRDSIDHVCVLPRLKQFACVENHSPDIALYSSRSGEMQACMRCPAVPLGICYVEPLHCLVAACADATMVTFNVGGEFSQKLRYKQRSMWPTPDTQLAMCWQPAHRLLYSGSVGGRVNAWDVETRDQKSCLEGHTDIVTQVLSLDYLDSIVSSSLDTTINIWDTYTEQQTARLVGHSKGVNSVAYNETHRLLISSGFDHDVFIWSPFVSTLLNRLKGHRASLVGCETVQGTHELITADASGIFKLWDLRNFQCIQTFTTDHEPGDLDDLTGSLSCFAHAKLPMLNALNLGGHKDDDDGGDAAASHSLLEDYRLIAGSKKLSFFDQVRKLKEEPVSDDSAVRLACFNTDSFTILTASEHTVKIWDAVLGTVKRIFKGLVASEITALCLDDRQRKFILGESSGVIGVFDYRNGDKMKTFAPQYHLPVVQLAYSDHAKALLAAYQDSTVRIYDENDIEECTILRELDPQHSHKGDLSALAFMVDSGLCVTGGGDGLRLWDFETGKCDAMVPTGDFEVLAMSFLGLYPFVALACSDAKVRVYGTQQSPFQSLCVAEWTNALPSDAYLSAAADEAAVPFTPAENQGEGAEYNRPSAEIDRNERIRASMALAKEIALEQEQALKKKVPAPASAPLLPLPLGGIPDAPLVRHPDFFPIEQTYASPVTSLDWDSSVECLYTGDEGGHLRKWSLQAMLASLKVLPLETSSVGGGRRRVKPAAQQTFTVDQARSMCEFPSQARSRGSSQVSFVWGSEAAHGAVITTVKVCSGEGLPTAVLTSSTDRCARMFTVGGGAIGLLEQNAPAGCRHPKWDLEVQVEVLNDAETERVNAAIAGALQRRRAADPSRRMREERKREKAEAKAVRRAAREEKALRREAGRTMGSRGRKLHSEKEQNHKMVLSVLANVRDVHGVASGGGSSTHSAEGIGSGGSSLVSVGDPKLREKSRHLPPYLRMADPMSRPPIELTSLGAGLGSHQSSSSHDHHHHHEKKLPRIIVPGSQAAGSGGVGGDIVAAMERLKGRR